jgi:hypothetical protein
VGVRRPVQGWRSVNFELVNYHGAWIFCCSNVRSDTAHRSGARNESGVSFLCTAKAGIGTATLSANQKHGVGCSSSTVVLPCYIPPTGYAPQVGEHCATVAVYLRFGTGHEAPDNPSEVSVKGIRYGSYRLTWASVTNPRQQSCLEHPRRGSRGACRRCMRAGLGCRVLICWPCVRKAIGLW